jgi:hypothetical protein
LLKENEAARYFSEILSHYVNVQTEPKEYNFHKGLYEMAKMLESLIREQHKIHARLDSIERKVRNT